MIIYYVEKEYSIEPEISSAVLLHVFLLCFSEVIILSLYVKILGITSRLGAGSPEGWLWISNKEAAEESNAALNTSLGWIREPVIVPADTLSMQSILFFTSRCKAIKCSFVSCCRKLNKA